METTALGRLIRQKLRDGRLPRGGVPRIWGQTGTGEECRACEEVVPRFEFVMEGIAAGDEGKLHFHVLCFYMWDDERRAMGR